MTGGRAPKAKGSAFERDVVHFLHEMGFEHAERRYGAGRNDDMGDIDGVPGVIFQCKAGARADLGAWLTETDVQAARAHAHGLLVVKRRMRPIADAFTIGTLRTVASLLRD